METLQLRLPSPIVELADERINRLGIRLFLKRDDLINPDIPGNKWRKLKYNIGAAKDDNHSTLLTFGGAYSNHIRAVAAAGYYFNFETVGVIRGEEHRPLNDSLAYAAGRGMNLVYMDRASYRDKSSTRILDHLRYQYGDFYLIPEGGSNSAAVRGCAELPDEIDIDFDFICCACGTGGTLAGISSGLARGQQAIGFSVLKGNFLASEVAKLQKSAIDKVLTNWSVNTDYHFGGFAKRKPELDAFIESFECRHQIKLEWVYVAKMMYGIFALAQHGTFPSGSRIVAVITG